MSFERLWVFYDRWGSGETSASHSQSAELEAQTSEMSEVNPFSFARELLTAGPQVGAAKRCSDLTAAPKVLGVGRSARLSLRHVARTVKAA